MFVFALPADNETGLTTLSFVAFSSQNSSANVSRTVFSKNDPFPVDRFDRDLVIRPRRSKCPPELFGNGDVHLHSTAGGQHERGNGNISRRMPETGRRRPQVVFDRIQIAGNARVDEKIVRWSERGKVLGRIATRQRDDERRRMLARKVER